MDPTSSESAGRPLFGRDAASAEVEGGPLGLVSGMVCVCCGGTYGVLKSTLWCPKCGSEGILDVQYDYGSIGKVLTPGRLEQTARRTQWRYQPLLPVRGAKRIPPLEPGWTPFYDAPALAQTVGMDRIWLKDEGNNPTGSIEDRGAAVAITRAREDRYALVTCGATGNLALSVAALAASAGQRTMLFVSQEADEGFVAQLLLFGAEVFVVEGAYEDALRLSLQCADEYGWYNCNRAVNPYLVEGERTVAFELGEQMHWAVPDCVVVSVAEGSTIAAVWKGYGEMKRLGWIKNLPKMIGVQAEGAAPVYAAWKEERDPLAVSPRTLATSLAVGAPRNWRKAIAAVRESGGLMVTVSDREILQAMHLLGERSGLIAEPGSAATLAGLVSLLRSRVLARTTSAVLLIAGSGLRHPSAAIEAAGEARTIPPNFDQLRMILQRAMSRTPF